jgi:16S rRNA (uracil1498-N3)-methyltransferase
MRLTRIHVNSALAAGVVIQIPAEPAQHLVKVLRLKAGAALRLFNGHGGEWDARIESIARNALAVRIGAHHAIERESPLQISLLQGIARGEKMDLILQKATELGVTAVVPVTTLRSTVRLDAEAAVRKHAHWRGVLIGACEQSGRNLVPTLGAATGLADAFKGIQPGLKVLLEPAADATTLKTLLTAAFHSAMRVPSVCLLVGPEGGLDPQEVQLAQKAGFVACRLGPRVLRTETAALAALATMQTLAGDFI